MNKFADWENFKLTLENKINLSIYLQTEEDYEINRVNYEDK